jgi:hypothetical protein
VNSACLLVSNVHEACHSIFAARTPLPRTERQMFRCRDPQGWMVTNPMLEGPGMYAGAQACHITPPVASLSELEVLRKSAETPRMEELTIKVAVRNWERTQMHQSVDTTTQHPALMVRTGWLHTVDHHGNTRVCYCTLTPKENVRSTRSQQHQRDILRLDGCRPHPARGPP